MNRGPLQFLNIRTYIWLLFFITSLWKIAALGNFRMYFTKDFDIFVCSTTPTCCSPAGSKNFCVASLRTQWLVNVIVIFYSPDDNDIMSNRSNRFISYLSDVDLLDKIQIGQEAYWRQIKWNEDFEKNDRKVPSEITREVKTSDLFVQWITKTCGRNRERTRSTNISVKCLRTV